MLGDPSLTDANPGGQRWPVLVTLLLIGYWCLTISSKFDTCNTFDEMAHLGNGASFWHTGDYRLFPESILLQRWTSIPAVVGGHRFPDTNQQPWFASDNWGLSKQYLFELGNDADRMILGGRMMTALLGTALALTVFLLPRSLFGPAGGLISLIAFVFHPSLLAHGGLITTDVGTTLFFTLSTATLWAVLQCVTPWTLLASTLAMAALFVSKMSCVLIIPTGIVLLAIRLADGRPLFVKLGQTTWTARSRLAQALIAAGLLAAHVLVTWAIIWTLFGFRYEQFVDYQPDRDSIYSGGWDVVISDSGRLGKVVQWARENRLLPEAYLFNFANSLRFTGSRVAFLNGEVSIFGWRTFFPFAFLVKTPLPILLLLILATIAWFATWWPGAPEHRGRRMMDSLYRSAHLWVLIAIYGGVAITSKINIGERHLLPIYPALLVLLGGSVRWLTTGSETADSASEAKRIPALGWAVLLLLGWLVVETTYRWPNYLAYFNQLVGGPSKGYRHLVDSSLDWGQDLPRLRKWVAKHVDDREPVFVSYFGTALPEYYGVRGTLLPGFFNWTPRLPASLEAGTYCISASMLSGVYTQPAGRWSADAEQVFRTLMGQVQELEATKWNPDARRKLIEAKGTQLWEETLATYQRAQREPAGLEHALPMLEKQVKQFEATKDDPKARRELINLKGSYEWQEVLFAYDRARLARLCSFLRRRTPDAQVGYSINIYRLSAEEVQEAQTGPIDPLR